MTWQAYFPYKPRFGQDKICDFVSRAIGERKIAIVEAPYGIGKTASMLAAGLSHALAEGRERKKIIFATCDHAVQNTIVREVLGINEKLGKKLVVAAIIGKEHMCPHLHRFNYEACDFEKLHRRCPFFNHTYKKGRISKGASEKTQELLTEISDIVKNKPDFLMNKNFVNFVIEKCTSAGLCPYEFMLELAARADVVILDYFHVFTPILSFMRKRVFNPEKCILFIDEADRLKDRLLDILTRGISNIGLQRLKGQVKKAMAKAKPKTLDDFEKLDEEDEKERDKKDRYISHAQWLFYLRFLETFEEFIREKEKKRPDNNRESIYINTSKQEFIDFLEDRLYDIDEIIDKVSNIVDKLTDSESGSKVVLRLDEFLQLWQDFYDNYFSYVLLDGMKKSLVISSYELAQTPLIEKEKEEAELCFVDILKSFHSSILFSATIGNVDIFAESLGILDFKRFLSYEFNTQDYMVILKRDISSVYKERARNVGKVVRDLAFCKKMVGNALVSFPSYDCCNSVLQHLDAKPIQDAGSEGTYYVVTGGKGSRGINKAAGLNVAYIYGLQLAKPDDYLFNKRKEFALKKYGQEKALKLIYNDVVNKSCQTAGRIFRDAGKKGTVVLADRRYRYDFRLKSFFFDCIPSYFKVKMVETLSQEQFEQAMIKFWQN